MEAWAGRSSQRANPRDRGYGAERGARSEQATNNGFRADITVTRTASGHAGTMSAICTLVIARLALLSIPSA